MRLLIYIVLFGAGLYTLSCKQKCSDRDFADNPCPDPVDCTLHYCNEDIFPYVLFNPGSTWRYVNEQANDTVTVEAIEKHTGRDSMGRLTGWDCERLFLGGSSAISEQVRTNLLMRTNTESYTITLSSFGGDVTLRNFYFFVGLNNYTCSSLQDIQQYSFSIDDTKYSGLEGNYQCNGQDTFFYSPLPVKTFNASITVSDSTSNNAILLHSLTENYFDLDSIVILPSVGLYAFKLCNGTYRLLDYHLE